MTDRYSTVHEIIVLFEGEAAKKSHQGLFALPDVLYCPIKGGITENATAVSPGVSLELHIAGGWETILQAALWSRAEPWVCDVLDLLKKSGMTDDELSLFEGLDFHEIFCMLCRQERFEVLRRICNTAKANVENRCSRGTRVHCHIVSAEGERIIASSL